MGIWFINAFITTVLWAFNNVFDEIAIKKYVHNEYRYSFWFYLARFPLFIILALIVGLSIPSGNAVLITILSGFINALPFIFYYRTLQKVDAYSVSLAYTALHPLLTYLLSLIFLHDTLTGIQAGGFAVLCVAALLSVLRFDVRVTINKGLLPLVPAVLLWSIGDVIWDYAVDGFQSPAQMLPWIALGGGFTAILFFAVPWLRKKMRAGVQAPVPRAGYAIFIITLCAVFIGYGTFLAALSYGHVALTSALTATQPLVVFIIAVIVSRVSKLYAREKITALVLLPKLLSLLCAVAGVYMLNV